MTATVAGIHLGIDTHANRPAANTVPDGSIYSCSTHSLIYKSNFAGNSWATWATLGTGASGSITASGYTQNTARLLGRTTASSGAIEEITVGSGLSLAAGSLTATGGASVGSTLQRVTRTAGNLSLAANTTTHTEVSSALRLTLPAASGDVIMVGISSLLTQGGTGEAEIDTATIVGGAIVNQFSPGTSAIGHGYTTAALRSIGATLTYVLQSGDVSGGNVIVSPTFRNTDGAAAGTLRAASDYALVYWAVNLKQ